MGIFFNSVVLPYLRKQIPIGAKNNPPNVQFCSNESKDTFEINSPKKYTSEVVIRKLSNQNPRIDKLLEAAGVEKTLNINGLNEVLKTHCTDTQIIAEGIVNNLPYSLKQKADLEAIKEAAYLHDIGKVFVPDNILNKNSKLDDRETEIMHLHPELGYELLKNTDINPKVLNLIRNHHQNAQKSGYPKADKNFNADLDLQILSMADKYSALREQRPYKSPLNREQALTIIRCDVISGKLNPLVYNALVSYTDETALQKASSKVS